MIDCPRTAAGLKTWLKLNRWAVTGLLVAGLLVLLGRLTETGAEFPACACLCDCGVIQPSPADIRAGRSAQASFALLFVTPFALAQWAQRASRRPWLWILGGYVGLSVLFILLVIRSVPIR